MEKREVIQALHAMMISRLFGGRPWLADREACDALCKKLDDLGLQERVRGDEHTFRNTPLGNELQINLILVFLGLWVEWEVPGILEDYGLIDEIDTYRLFDLLEISSDPEYVLRPVVRKAFKDHYNPTGLLT